jgi:hypothetical protein
MTRTKKAPKDTLETYTGHDRLWWMRFVQKRIAANSGPRGPNGHSPMLSYDWIGHVVATLFKTAFPKDGPAYDPNMRIAFLLTLVMGTWYSRVQHSKTFDPRRPKKIRRAAYESWRNSVTALLGSLISEHDDPLVFNGKPFYENPFDPKAKDGKYV